MPPAGENAAFYRARIGRLLHFEFQSRLHKVQHKPRTREPAPVFCAAYVGVFFYPKNTIESLHAAPTRDDLSRRKRAFAAAMRRNHTVTIEAGPPQNPKILWGKEAQRSDELFALEPNVSPDAIAALSVPESGICDPYGITFGAAERLAKALKMDFFPELKERGKAVGECRSGGVEDIVRVEPVGG